MTRHIFLPLLLSTAVAFPVLAQQTNSPSSDQSTSQSVSSGPREPIPAQTPTDFWDGDNPNLVNLITHPFANKKYVERHVGPIRDRINELDQITSGNAGTIKDVDTRATQGIQLASEKVNLADQHATDANSKAQMAQTSATEASTKVSTVEQMVGNLDQYKGDAQTETRFRAGQTVLSKSAKDALDEMASKLKGQRSYIIAVRGFAPGHGSGAISSLREMADSVVRYLVLNHDIPVYRVYVMSMGNAPAAGGDGTLGKASTGGRVEVNVMKNEMAGSVQH